MIDPSSELSQMDSIVGLFAMLVFNIGTATLTEFEQGARYGYMVMYTVFGFVVLWPMMLIVNRTKTTADPEPREVFAHDHTTMGAGRWLVGCSLVIFCYFVGTGFTGNWIGQQRAPLIVSGMTLTSFTDGVPGMWLKVIGRPHNFGGRVPREVSLMTQLNQEIVENWAQSKASWVKLSDDDVLLQEDGHPIRITEEAEFIRPESPTVEPVEAVFEGLADDKATYVFNLDLKPTDQDAVSQMVAEYSRASDEEEKAELAKSWRDSYEQKFNAAKEQIIKRGGARVWWKEPPGYWGNP